MEKRVILSLAKLREEGELRQSGEVDSELLDPQEGNLISAGAISYVLEARLYDKEIVVKMRAEVPMHGQCDRCLGELDYTAVAQVEQGIEMNGEEDKVDLSEMLREELILSIPAYPKCELVGKKCQINDIMGNFGLDKAPLSGVNSGTPSSKSVWDALDEIKAPEPQAENRDKST